MSRVLRLLSVLTIAAIALACWAPVVGAHAELIRSSPALGSLATTDIDVVRMEFTPLDDASPYELEVVDSSDQDVTTGPVVRIDQGTIQVPVAIETIGEYTVRYVVTGIDGDESTGSYTFTVEEPSASSGLPIIFLWVAALAVAALLFLRRPSRTRT